MLQGWKPVLKRYTFLSPIGKVVFEWATNAALSDDDAGVKIPYQSWRLVGADTARMALKEPDRDHF
ncbi:hypothetical protein P4S64_11890 [Vibrio sp. M60_M31a]